MELRERRVNKNAWHSNESNLKIKLLMVKNCSGIIWLSLFVIEELTEFLVSQQSTTCYSGVARNSRYFFLTIIQLRSELTSHERHEPSSTSVRVRPSCRVDRTSVLRADSHDLFINPYGTWASGFSPSCFYRSGARITSVRNCDCACVSVKSKKASCWTSCIVQPCVTEVGSLRR